MPDQQNFSFLPMLALKEVPQPQPDAKQIVALVKDRGRICGYQLNDGKILDRDTAVQLARQGGIKGVGIGEKQGTEYLKSLPDDTQSNNLGNLPTVSQ